jgi:hypothetical protein
MKIVKQFEDPEFLAITYNWVSSDNLSREHFYWGLGEDGELYCKCSRFIENHLWHPPCAIGNLEDKISLKLMRRIVKEFGHLVVFT